jgi:hypothetical protein
MSEVEITDLCMDCKHSFNEHYVTNDGWNEGCAHDDDCHYECGHCSCDGFLSKD